jgi:hypothetical protein
MTEGTVSRGERVDASACGPGIVESMAEVIARDRAAPKPAEGDPRAADLRYGMWVVPSRRATTFPRSGEHTVVNKWGDTRMGITFPDVVDVHGAYFAGQAGEGAWTSGVRVVGYRDDFEVGRTDWFAEIGDKPAWFEMNLCGVDRIIILSKPVLNGGGWYGMDDLTFTFHLPEDQGPTVLDFEDVGYNTTLSGTGYAGLTWEWGSGSELTEPVHAPKVPPGRETLPPAGVPDGDRLAPQDSGTLPDELFSFQGVVRGDADSWSYPPDTMGAVGPDHYVQTVNRNFAVYDKTSGAELMNVHLGSFLPGSNGDPRVLFDQHSQRWIVIATDFNETARIFLAVSTTSDPLYSWFKTSWVTSQGSDAGNWPDYPTLGVDVNGIYTAASMIGGGEMTLFVLDKAPLIAPEPELGTITAFRQLPWEGAIQPAHTFGNAGGEYCVSVHSSTSLRIRRVNTPLTAPTLSELGFVTIPYHSPPSDAPALGSSTPLDTVDERPMMSVYRSGSLWTCHTINVGGRAACRWYQIELLGMSLVQYGTVSDPVMRYFFPSIMVNRYGHAVMGFTGSSPSHYASAYYTGRRADDVLGEMGPPVLYKAGTAPQNNIDPYGRNRWGDYSYTTLDPADELSFWMAQEYGHETDIWGNYIIVLNAADCNNNQIPDECDLDCGEPGGECDVPGCGGSPDCNGNDLPDECDVAPGGESSDTNGNGIPDECEVEAPLVVDEGCRYFAVTPQPPDLIAPVALQLTGDPGDDKVSCVSLYIQGTRALGDTPVFKTPVEWGTVHVTGEAIVPDRTYHVRAEMPGGATSEAGTVTTWRWGDADHNNIPNLNDILLIVYGFQGNFTQAAREAVDMLSCAPNGVINLDDIMASVGAFQGNRYEDTICSLPCP